MNLSKGDLVLVISHKVFGRWVTVPPVYLGSTGIIDDIIDWYSDPYKNLILSEDHDDRPTILVEIDKVNYWAFPEQLEVVFTI